MLGYVRWFVPRHSVWLLVVLTLLAVAERRIAAYSQWPDADQAILDGDAQLGERIFQALLFLPRGDGRCADCGRRRIVSRFDGETA